MSIIFCIFEYHLKRDIMNLLDKLWKVLESNEESELKDVLLEVELWEAGRVDVNENGEVWVSGDNGVAEITTLVKDL